MNARWFNLLSSVLILIGLLCLGYGWSGSATMTGAFPFHASSVQLTGSATGANALIGVPALFLGLALMIVCMIWTIVDTVQNTTVKK